MASLNHTASFLEEIFHSITIALEAKTLKITVVTRPLPQVITYKMSCEVSGKLGFTDVPLLTDPITHPLLDCSTLPWLCFQSFRSPLEAS